MRWGPFLVDRDSIFVGKPGKWWGVHIDLPGFCTDVKNFGVPHQLVVHMYPLGCVTIGLPDPGGRNFFDPDEPRKWHITRSWAWSPRWGYRGPGRWRVVTYTPPKWVMCQATIREVVGRSGKTRYEVCGKWRWHRGPHFQEEWPKNTIIVEVSNGVSSGDQV